MLVVIILPTVDRSFWKIIYLIRMINVNCCFKLIVDRRYKLLVDWYGSLSIDLCFSLWFLFSFIVAVENCNELWIISNFHVACLLLDNSHWIIVDSKVYECQAQLLGPHVILLLQLPWRLSQVIEKNSSWAWCPGIDSQLRDVIDRCLTMNVDLRTGSMVSYGILSFYFQNAPKSSLFFQNTHEPVNVLKSLQYIINSS